MKAHPLAPWLQGFFTDRLVNQLRASPNTISSYRDTFKLLLRFASGRLRRTPTELRVEDIDADLVALFLSDIEKSRRNSARSRNTRLSAIRSFFKYLATNQPQLLHHCQRVIAMPAKRYDKRTISYLTQTEINAVIAAPDPTTSHGRRDRVLLVLAFQTGLRVSELINLTCGDVVLGVGAHVRCMGKGRKERATPLRKDCVKILQDWLVERGGSQEQPLFVSKRAQRLSRDAIEQLVRKHVLAAARQCPSLKKKRVTPHVLRHTAAMQLLQSGVDRTVIALWLGHESVETTQMYIHADMTLKEKAMARTRPNAAAARRYRPSDQLIDFLDAI